MKNGTLSLLLRMIVQMLVDTIANTKNVMWFRNQHAFKEVTVMHEWFQKHVGHAFIMKRNVTHLFKTENLLEQVVHEIQWVTGNAPLFVHRNVRILPQFRM